MESTKYKWEETITVSPKESGTNPSRKAELKRLEDLKKQVQEVSRIRDHVSDFIEAGSTLQLENWSCKIQWRGASGSLRIPEEHHDSPVEFFEEKIQEIQGHVSRQKQLLNERSEYTVAEEK